MDYSPIFIDLKEKIEEYIEKSSKKEYRFSIEEQYELERLIRILNNQADILIKYEIDKLEKGEK